MGSYLFRGGDLSCVWRYSDDVISFSGLVSALFELVCLVFRTMVAKFVPDSLDGVFGREFAGYAHLRNALMVLQVTRAFTIVIAYTTLCGRCVRSSLILFGILRLQF